jgi:hypothetical protein
VCHCVKDACAHVQVKSMLKPRVTKKGLAKTESYRLLPPPYVLLGGSQVSTHSHTAMAMITAPQLTQNIMFRFHFHVLYNEQTIPMFDLGIPKATYDSTGSHHDKNKCTCPVQLACILFLHDSCGSLARHTPAFTIALACTQTTTMPSFSCFAHRHARFLLG